MSLTTIQTTPSEFAARILAVADEYAAIAAEYVDILDQEPDFGREVASCGVPRDFLNRLEMVGRGQLDNRLLFAESPAERRLMRAPISVQREILSKPQPGVEIYDAGRPDDVRFIPLAAMTSEQARIAINETGITPVAKQRTLVEKKAGSAPEQPKADYVLTGDKVHFTSYWVDEEVLKKALAQLKARGREK